jgi:hypothetical protein
MRKRARHAGSPGNLPDGDVEAAMRADLHDGGIDQGLAAKLLRRRRHGFRPPHTCSDVGLTDRSIKEFGDGDPHCFC